jgi:PmbA protein
MKEQITATALLDRAAAQAGAAELYEVRSLELPVRFRAGALESLRSVETAGRALRVIQDGRLGFSTTSDLADGTAVVENALASATYGDPAGFQFPAPGPMPAVRCFDPAIEALDEEQLITLGEEVIERLRSYDADLQVDVSIDKRVEEVRLVNTSGLALEDRRTSLAFGVDAIRTQGDDVLVLWQDNSSRARQKVDGAALVDALIRRLRWSDKVVPVAPRPMPVVFNLTATAALLLPLMLGLNGREVYQNTSPLGDKLGQPVLDARLTLVDDGRLDDAVRSARFDDEGVPTTAKPLVAEGVVQAFLYDLRTAGQARAQPTGNGFKSDFLRGGGYETRPGTQPGTWLVSPGDQSLEQILAGLDEALLVEGVLGLGQGNVAAGEFSNNVVVGFLVQRGEIVGRVKDTMIAGNVYELLKERLLALGDRAEWLGGTMRAPALAVDGVNVASKG